MSLRDMLRRMIVAIEPWYDWGTTNAWRMDCNSLAEADANEFEVRFFEFQWLGFHIEFRTGRAPAKVTV